MLRYAITDRTQLRNNAQVPHPSAATGVPGERSLRAGVAEQMGGMYDFQALIEQAAHLAATGIDYLQLRERELPAATLASLVREILAILSTHNSATKLLINSRADIAIATRAHGVHLTSAPCALTSTQVRALYTQANLPIPTISLSCHTLEEITLAASCNPDNRPDLILFGPVFEKAAAASTTPGSGLELLHAACLAAAPIPVLALGGITEQNTPATLAAGAAGIAAIRLFLS